MHRLARDAGISQATGYRYLREVISVLAEQAPTCTRSWSTAETSRWRM